MKYFLFSTMIFSCCFLLNAQRPDTLWTKTIGGGAEDYGWDVQQTSDNGFIAVGATQSYGAGGVDMYIIKTDANGDTNWTKTYGGSSDDIAQSIIKTNVA